MLSSIFYYSFLPWDLVYDYRKKSFCSNFLIKSSIIIGYVNILTFIIKTFPQDPQALHLRTATRLLQPITPQRWDACFAWLRDRTHFVGKTWNMCKHYKVINKIVRLMSSWICYCSLKLCDTLQNLEVAQPWAISWTTNSLFLII